MAENYNLESKERLFKEFSHFSVGERNPAKIFTNRQRGKYVGGVPLAYDAERNLIAMTRRIRTHWCGVPPAH